MKVRGFEFETEDLRLHLSHRGCGPFRKQRRVARGLGFGVEVSMIHYFSVLVSKTHNIGKCQTCLEAYIPSILHPKHPRTPAEYL